MAGSTPLRGRSVQARAVWDVGDLVNPAENDAWQASAGRSNFYEHDFGELRLDAPPVGTYRWQGQIQAKGDAARGELLRGQDLVGSGG